MKELIETKGNQNKSTNTKNTTNSVFTHLSSLTGLFVPIPFISILFPLILWQAFKKDDQYSDHHGKEAVNFNLSFLLYNFTLGIISIIFFGMTLFKIISSSYTSNNFDITSTLLSTSGFIIMILIFTCLIIIKIVIIIIAAIKASQNIWYKYPLSIRFIK